MDEVRSCGDISLSMLPPIGVIPIVTELLLETVSGASLVSMLEARLNGPADKMAKSSCNDTDASALRLSTLHVAMALS
jgi:hypothetical protein